MAESEMDEPMEDASVSSENAAAWVGGSATDDDIQHFTYNQRSDSGSD